VTGLLVLAGILGAFGLAYLVSLLLDLTVEWLGE
jgi:hypothetical protein